MFVYLDKGKELAFIHIPKTGGTLIKNILMPDGLRIGNREGIAPLLPSPVKWFFTFVRNPYRRMASLYHFWIARKGELPKGWELGHTPREFIEKQYKWGIPFEFSQTKFLENNDANPPIEVFKFENLHVDLARICDRVGRSLPWLEKSRENQFWGDYDWRQYIDRWSLNLINDQSAHDFKNFGYRMLTWDQLQKLDV